MTNVPTLAFSWPSNVLTAEAVPGEIPEQPEKPERKLAHQVRVVRIMDIEKHPNADTLGIVRIDGYQVVVKLGEFEVGSLAAYIQPDSVVPPEEEFAFMWDGRGFLPGDEIPLRFRRVTVRKFRKEWSEGMLVQIPNWVRIVNRHGDVVEPGQGDDIANALGVTHYDPPEPGDRLMQRKQRHGRPRSLKGWWYWLLELLGFRPNGDLGGHNRRGPKGERRVYDVERFQNHPNVLQPGEEVIVTEKIHGSNARYTFEDGEFFIGSRTMWKNPDAHCVWTDAVQQNPAIEAWCRAHPGYTLYGEVVPTQGEKYRYGCAPGQVTFFLFDILDPQGNWLTPFAVQNVNRLFRGEA